MRPTLGKKEKQIVRGRFCSQWSKGMRGQLLLGEKGRKKRRDLLEQLKSPFLS